MDKIKKSLDKRLYQLSGQQIMSPQSQHFLHKVQSLPVIPQIVPYNQNQVKKKRTREETAIDPLKDYQNMRNKFPINTLSHLDREVEQYSISNPQMLKIFSDIITLDKLNQTVQNPLSNNGGSNFNADDGLAITIYKVSGSFYTANPVRVACFIFSEDDLKGIQNQRVNQNHQKNIQLYGVVSSALPLQDLLIKHNQQNQLNDQEIKDQVYMSFFKGLNFNHTCALDPKKFDQIRLRIKNSGNPQQKLFAVVFLLEQIQNSKYEQQSTYKNDSIFYPQFNKNNGFNDHNILSYGYNDLIDKNNSLKFNHPQYFMAFDPKQDPRLQVKNQKIYPCEAEFYVRFESPGFRNISKLEVQFRMKKEAYENEDDYILKNLNSYLFEKDNSINYLPQENLINKKRKSQSTLKYYVKVGDKFYKVKTQKQPLQYQNNAVYNQRQHIEQTPKMAKHSSQRYLHNPNNFQQQIMYQNNIQPLYDIYGSSLFPPINQNRQSSFIRIQEPRR